MGSKASHRLIFRTARSIVGPPGRVGGRAWPKRSEVSNVHALRLEIVIKLAAAFVLLVAGGASISADAYAATKAAPPGGFDTKAKHAILMNVDADLIFYEKDADALVPPASMS